MAHLSMTGASVYTAEHAISAVGAFHAQGDIIIGDPSKDPKRLCKQALFLTNPKDDRASIIHSNRTLIPENCRWILDHASVRTWLSTEGGSQLLWISGGRGMGKTMMSLFLLNELEKSPDITQNSTIIYYFVDARQKKRSTAVAIIRGLIYLLLEAHPNLIKILLHDFELQGEQLFSASSVESLWRVFKTMLEDKDTGPVYCLIDGLNECQDDSVQPFLHCVKAFFQDEREKMMEWTRRYPGTPFRKYHPHAPYLKMAIASRESCSLSTILQDALRVELYTKRVENAGDSLAPETKLKPMKSIRKRKKDDSKLSKFVKLALQHQKLKHEAQSIMGCETISETIEEHTVSQTTGATSIESSFSALSLNKQTQVGPLEYVSTLELVPEQADSEFKASKESSDDPCFISSRITEVTGSEFMFEGTWVEEMYESTPAHPAEQDTESVESVEYGAEQHDSIRYYIETKVKELESVPGYSEDLRCSVVTALQSHGDIDFLWVDLAIEELKQCNPQYAAQVAKQLPNNVDGIYCRLLQRIPATMATIVAATLKLVVVARRPLGLIEIGLALQYLGMLDQIGFQDYDPAESARYVVSVSDQLLCIDNEMVVHLQNIALKDLLTGEAGNAAEGLSIQGFLIDVKKADQELAHLCLRYLENGCLDEGPVPSFDISDRTSDRFQRFGLLPYAGQFWPEHLRSASSPWVDLKSAFFGPQSAIRKYWWHSYYATVTNKLASTAPRHFTLLHLAAYLNIPAIAEELEKTQELQGRLNKRDSQHHTPLALAALRGNLNMFAYLSERGAAAEHSGVHVFEVACWHGQSEIVEYLLDSGHDVNKPVQKGNALATSDNFTRFTEQSEEGARNSHSQFLEDACSQGTALHHASVMGHTSLVRSLLRRGADINKPSAKRWTPLHSACWTGRVECAELLVKSGASIVHVNENGWTPLHCAAARGNSTIVLFFIRQGVPIDSLTYKQKSALHLAASGGHADTIKILLQAGAEVNRRSHKGDTPLHLASRSLKPKAVRILLELGAYGSIPNGYGQKPQDIVVAMGNIASQQHAETAHLLSIHAVTDSSPQWPSRQDGRARGSRVHSITGCSSDNSQALSDQHHRVPPQRTRSEAVILGTARLSDNEAAASVETIAGFSETTQAISSTNDLNLAPLTSDTHWRISGWISDPQGPVRQSLLVQNSQPSEPNNSQTISLESHGVGYQTESTQGEALPSQWSAQTTATAYATHTMNQNASIDERGYDAPVPSNVTQGMNKVATYKPLSASTTGGLSSEDSRSGRYYEGNQYQDYQDASVMGGRYTHEKRESIESFHAVSDLTYKPFSPSNIPLSSDERIRAESLISPLEKDYPIVPWVPFRK